MGYIGYVWDCSQMRSWVTKGLSASERGLMLLIKTNWLSFICSRASIRTNVIKQMEMLCFHLYVFFYPVIFRETPEKWKEFYLIMLDNLLHEFGLLTSPFRAQFLCLRVTSKGLFRVKIILFHTLDHKTLELWSLTLINKFPKLKEKKSTLWPWKMLHFILCVLFRHWYFPSSQLALV